MLVYILLKNQKFIYFGYKNYAEGTGNYTGPENDIATTNGYKKKSDNDIVPVIPATYFSGINNDINVVLESIKKIGKVEKLIVIGTNKLSFYLSHGESHDGFKDKQFKDTEYMKLLRSNAHNEMSSVTTDKLTRELLNLESGDWIFDDVKYWNPKVNKPIMMTGNKIAYFPTLRKIKDDFIYVATNVKENDELGKQISTINYTIMIGEEIKEVANLIEMLDLNLGQPVVIKTDILFRPDTVRSMRYGGLITKRYMGVIELRTPSGDVIALLYSPSGAMMAMQDDIAITLSIYNKNNIVDITDKIYENNLIKSKDNKFIIDVIVNGLNINVMTSVDTLTRNHLKRLEKLKPNVSLLYYERDKSMSYYTVITTENNVAISYSPFNNLVFKK